MCIDVFGFTEIVHFVPCKGLSSFKDETPSPRANTGRCTSKNEVLAASGHQGSRNRPDQLLPEGLSPKQHLACALELEHPFSAACSLGVTSEAGFRGATWDLPRLIGWRESVSKRLACTCGQSGRGEHGVDLANADASVFCLARIWA